METDLRLVWLRRVLFVKTMITISLGTARPCRTFVPSRYAWSTHP